MAVPTSKIFSAIGYLLIATSIVSSLSIDLQPARAERQSLKKTFRLSDYNNARFIDKSSRQHQNQTDKQISPKTDSQPTDRLSCERKNNTSYNPDKQLQGIGYENPNSFNSIQFGQVDNRGVSCGGRW